MNFPNPQPSPEGTFSRGAASPHAAPQGEASFPSHFRPDDDAGNPINGTLAADDALRMLAIGAGLVVAGIILVAFIAPVAAIAFICVFFSGMAIAGAVLFADNRGNREIGVSDTQGRDGGGK